MKITTAKIIYCFLPTHIIKKVCGEKTSIHGVKKRLVFTFCWWLFSDVTFFFTEGAVASHQTVFQPKMRQPPLLRKCEIGTIWFHQWCLLGVTATIVEQNAATFPLFNLFFPLSFLPCKHQQVSCTTSDKSHECKAKKIHLHPTCWVILVAMLLQFGNEFVHITQITKTTHNWPHGNRSFLPECCERHLKSLINKT